MAQKRGVAGSPLFCRFDLVKIARILNNMRFLQTFAGAWTLFPVQEKNRIAGLANRAFYGPGIVLVFHKWGTTTVEGGGALISGVMVSPPQEAARHPLSQVPDLSRVF